MEKEPDKASLEFNNRPIEYLYISSPSEELDIENPTVNEEEIPQIHVRAMPTTQTKILKQTLITPETSTLLEANSRDKQYIENYKKVQLGINPEEDTFVLTPRIFFEIERLLPEFTRQVASTLDLETKTRIWEASPILSILAKSLMEESIKYSTWIAKRIALKGDKSKPHIVCDLCSGAGITSSKVYKELKKDGFKNIQIHGVDNSIESLAVSYLVFKTQDIPCVLLNNYEKVKDIPADWNGIALIYGNAETYMGSIDESIKYSDIMSENGISYFSKEKHNKVLEDSKKHLAKGGGIYLSSLNPSLSVDLAKPFLIKEILTGKEKYQRYLNNIKKGKPQYIISEGKIKRAMTEQTGRQIEFMNYLLRTDMVDFLKYMKGLSKATTAAKILTKEILSPVNTVEKDLQEIFNIKDTDISKYPEINGAPCDVIEIIV